MRVLDGDQVLMRIFIGESKKHGRRPLYKVLVDLLREENIAGATVLKGLCGFGARSYLHTANLLRLSQDLPLVIEVVDTREKIDRILPEIDRIVPQGLITMEKVRVLRYAPVSNGS